MYRLISLFFLFSVSLAVSAALIDAAPLANRYGGLPEPILTPFRTFAIPFEVLPSNSADPSREIELLVSTDQGKKWFSAGKTGIETKQFHFKAENDGEYWFSFRTITLSGAVKQSPAGPQIRVLVQPDTVPQNPAESNQQIPQTPDDAEIQSLKRTKPEYGSPVLPPKPLRLNEIENKAERKPSAEKAALAPQVAKNLKPAADRVPSDKVPLLSSAAGEVIKPDERAVKKDENGSVPVEELFSRLNQFYGGKLTEETIIPTMVKEQSADGGEQGTEKQGAEKQSVPAGIVAGQSVPVQTVPPAEKQQAGKITGVSLNTAGTQPQITVKWDNGGEVWGEAARGMMADILRGKSLQGPWLPLATNQKNSGEYWWFVSQDDLMPFYLMVRLRTLDGVAAAGFTPSPIQVNPELLNTVRQH